MKLGFKGMPDIAVNFSKESYIIIIRDGTSSIDTILGSVY